MAVEVRRRRLQRAVALFVPGAILLLLWSPSRHGMGRVAGTPPGDSALVWIYLNPAAARDTLRPALSPAALRRRARLGIAINQRDRPLPPGLVRRLVSAGARVRVQSRWLRAVSAWVARTDLRRIAALPFVQGIRPVAHFAVPSALAASRARLLTIRPSPRAAGGARPAGAAAPATGTGTCDLQSTAGFGTPPFYGALYSALKQMDIPAAQALGLTGQGIKIALLDTGFLPSHVALAPLAVMATHDFINGDSVVSDQPGDVVTPIDPAEHGTEVWSVLAACAPGTMVGPAFGATFALAKVDDPNTETHADEDRWVAGLEWADSLGVQIVNSSLGYRYFDDSTSYSFAQLNGRTAASTVAAAQAAARGLLIVNAMGNDGPQFGTLLAPADADSIIAVGGVDSVGNVYYTSSRGPTADGRRKPELAARGVDMPVARATSVNSYAIGFRGTSLATPLITGAAALVEQAWPDLNAMAVRRALLLAGNRALTPDDAVGNGVPDVLAAISFPQGVAPFNVEGTDAQGTLTTLTPTFRWSVPLVYASARPVKYYIELARDSTFADVVYRDSIGDAQAFVPRQAVRPVARLWWRVVAAAANGATRVSRSGTPVHVPAWVSLINLDNTSGSYTAEQSPTFYWHALSAAAPVGPLRFDVQVLDGTTGKMITSVTGVTDTTATTSAPLQLNTPYRWRVIARSQGGVADSVESVAPFVVVSETAPPSTQLYQNFPNPFPGPSAPDGTTQFWFDLSRSSPVRLEIFDLRGRLVRRLIPLPGCAQVVLPPGRYGRARAGEGNPCVLTHWDGTSDDGRTMPPGVYLARLSAAGVQRVVRVLFLPR